MSLCVYYIYIYTYDVYMYTYTGICMYLSISLRTSDDIVATETRTTR